MDYPITEYPTLTATDPNILYESLGSFWSQVFQERDTIKGYTIGQAEELIQHYFNLVEVLDSYSVHDIPLFHREKWYPLIIKKSEYDNAPLLFEPNDAVFGVQPNTDPYYAGMIFKFGFPKNPSAKIYSFVPPTELAQFSLFANRIINPSNVFINNVDVQYTNGVLYFNRDLFAAADISKMSLIGDNGESVTYVDRNGDIQDDELVILWGYNVETNVENLFGNIGYVFDIKLSNDDAYKGILQSVMNLFVDGPTIKSIKALSAAFVGVKPVVEPVEVIQEIFVTITQRVVITDKNVYKFDIYYDLNPGLAVGSLVYAGDVLVDAVEFFDQVQVRNWWLNKISPKILQLANPSADPYTPQMSFPPNMFVGGNKHAFSFKNELELVTCDANGNIRFPVHGEQGEVDRFNAYINQSSEQIRTALGLPLSGAIAVNPLDFIFENFLKYNTALIKFNFKNTDQAATFLSFFKYIKNSLPKHVFFIFYFDFMFDNENYDVLNGSTTIQLSGVDTITNSDGSNNNGFMVEEVADGKYKTNIATRLFALSRALKFSGALSYNSDLLNFTHIPSALIGQDNPEFKLDNSFAYYVVLQFTDVTSQNPIVNKSGELFRVYQENGGPFMVEYNGQTLASAITPVNNTFYLVSAWYNVDEQTLYIKINNNAPDSMFAISANDLGGDLNIGYSPLTHESLLGSVWTIGYSKQNLISEQPAIDIYNNGTKLNFADLTIAAQTATTAWWDLNDATLVKIDVKNGHTLVDAFGNLVITNTSGAFDPIYKSAVVANRLVNAPDTMVVMDGNFTIPLTAGKTTKEYNSLLLLDFG